MKKLIIVLAVFLILFLVVYGYFKAVPSTGQARIEITPQFFDFGQAEYGQVLKHSFVVKNIGSEVLEIKKIATSCGCTTAETKEKSLSPGETTDLLVEYNTGLMSGSHAKGQQERIIYVKSNDPVNPQIEATITAYVK